jgi:hypothetical protein
MTVQRPPVLTCDRRHCLHAVRAPLHVTSVREVREYACTLLGWGYFDRKDWCPEHAAELGIRTAA